MFLFTVTSQDVDMNCWWIVQSFIIIFPLLSIEKIFLRTCQERVNVSGTQDGTKK